MEPKPLHLGPEYAAQFEDDSVAAAYATRPPYPDELFDVLEALLPGGPRVVLDLGCGTGDIAIRLAERSVRIDAVDPSESMLAMARSRPGSDNPAIRWICASAEEFEIAGPYSMAVAGESFHWMDWRVVPERIAGALHPRGYLALVVDRTLIDVAWEDALAELIPRYSTNRDFRAYDLVTQLRERGVFREVGRHSTHPVPFRQTIGDYVESCHSRNGFSRERMAVERAAEFDEAVRSLVAPHCPNGMVEGKTISVVVWGLPSAA